MCARVPYPNTEMADHHTMDMLSADFCSECVTPWPCDTAVALAEVERLRGVVEAVLGPMDTALESAKRENGGSTLIWADEVARWQVSLRAALEEGE